MVDMVDTGLMDMEVTDLPIPLAAPEMSADIRQPINVHLSPNMLNNLSL